MVDQIPKHLAIIPDGNRRWAREKGLQVFKGHERSTQREHITSLLDEAHSLGVKYVSLWGFSTENWKRSSAEKKFLFALIIKMAEELKDYSHENKVRFRHIGRRDRLPRELVRTLEEFEDETKDYDGLNMQLLLDYGGRDDIMRAVKKLIESGEKECDENKFLEFLDTKGIPEPDLIIRTSGEKRLSGLMLYQAAYAELYFSDKYFPDFKPEDLREAVRDFSDH